MWARMRPLPSPDGKHFGQELLLRRKKQNNGKVGEMNQEEEPREWTDDENAPKPPETEIQKAFRSHWRQLMGQPEIVTVDHTKDEEEPNQKRESHPDILDRIRNDRERHRIQDEQPCPRPKARDPYDVFRPNKNPRVPQSKKDEVGDTEKNLSEAERRVLERYRMNLAKIEADAQRKRWREATVNPPDDTIS
jgi:hypothetical protein